REGLHHLWPGDRWDGHSAGPGNELDPLEEEGLHWPTLPSPKGYGAAGPETAGWAASGRAGPASTGRCPARRRARRNHSDEDDRPRDVELSQRDARPDVRPRHDPERTRTSRHHRLRAAERPRRRRDRD